jgi:hypothetical protein
MHTTKENVEWAIRKLSRFRTWPGFPSDGEGIRSRARSFLRLVHNRSVREILTEAAERNRRDPALIEWKIDPEANDADWILDLIEETMETFPLPVQMREIYSTYVPPASVFGEVPSRENA